MLLFQCLVIYHVTLSLSRLGLLVFILFSLSSIFSRASAFQASDIAGGLLLCARQRSLRHLIDNSATPPLSKDLSLTFCFVNIVVLSRSGSTLSLDAVGGRVRGRRHLLLCGRLAEGVEMAGRVLGEPLHIWLGPGAVWMGSEM